MKGTQVEAVNRIVYVDQPDPVPAPGEVVVRVHYTGVCGSDVPRVLQGTVHSFPQTLGHESAGVVSAVGEGVDEALVGTRVSVLPLVPCGECPDCQVGRFSLCKHYSFIGSRRPGTMAEYVAVPAQKYLSPAMTFPIWKGLSSNRLRLASMVLSLLVFLLARTPS